MKTTLPWGLLILICVLCFSEIRAQDSETKQDTTVISDEIEEITVTAFRSPYNIFNTPAPVNLILPEVIETGSALTPVEALNHIPGILMHHGTLNTNRLTIRGIGSRTPYATNKIKAYFGEIPLTSGDGETTLEDLENTGIKRVEIIKGPSSSLYGAGLAGVILFHPKTVVRDFVRNQTTAASFGTLKNTITAGVDTEQLKLFTLGSVLNSNGYRDNNNTDRKNILLNSMYSFSDKSNVQVLLKATKMKGYIPSSLDLQTFLEAPESAAANWNSVKGFEEYSAAQIGISYNRFTLKDGKISVAAFGSFKELDEVRPFNILDESSKYLGWRAYMQKVVTVENARFVLTSGVEMFRESYDWATFANHDNSLLSDNNEKRQYENLFVQIESNFSDKLFISAGLNGNLTRFKYTDNFNLNGDQSGNHNYKPVISPRIGINTLLSDNYSVFGNVSHGFSTPTFEETLMPDGELNKDIKPESGWNFELGFRTRIADKLQFSANYFRIYVNDLLVARRTGADAYIGLNAGRSTHPGLEAEFTWHVLNGESFPKLALSGNATISNYHFDEFIDLDNDYSGNLLPGTAKKTCLLSATLKPSKNFTINTWYRFTGEMPVNDANSDFSDSFGITNAEIKYRGTKGKLQLEFKAGIQNIFDVHYASMLAVNAYSGGSSAPRYYYPGNPRNYFFSVLIGWVATK